MQPCPTYAESATPNAGLEKHVTAIAFFPSYMRFAATFRALLLGPCGWFGCASFAFAFRFELLGASRVGLMNRALRVDASVRIGSRPADRTDFAARLRNPGCGLLFAHPVTPPTTSAP